MLVVLLLFHTDLVKAIVHHVLAMVVDIKHDANPRSGGGARPPKIIASCMPGVHEG